MVALRPKLCIFQTMRFSSLSLIVFLAVEAALAHPFDQVRADSNSHFNIKKATVELRLKFPVHAYVNLWVKSPQEYDKYVKTITSQKEQKKIRQYVIKHVKVFDGKNRLQLRLSSLDFERDQYLSDKSPTFIIVKGKYSQPQPLKEVFIFNELFKEGRVPHFGTSEIEMGDKVYDFVFREKRYFRLMTSK